jgi:hypothetical protein
VFHTIPQPSKDGSGPPTQIQHQRLEREGRRLRAGIDCAERLIVVRFDTLTVIRSVARLSFKNSCIDTSGSSVPFFLSASVGASVFSAPAEDGAFVRL